MELLRSPARGLINRKGHRVACATLSKSLPYAPTAPSGPRPPPGDRPCQTLIIPQCRVLPNSRGYVSGANLLSRTQQKHLYSSTGQLLNLLNV